MNHLLETLESPTATQGGENAAAESISRKDICSAYLAGIIDREGCIHAYFKKQTNPKARHCTTFTTAVTIWNTHPEMIRRVTEHLIEIGVPFVASLSRNGDKRKGIQVVIQGKGRLKKLLECILPYLSSKRKQAELALRIIEYRESLAERFTGRKGRFEFMSLQEDPTLRELIDALREEKHNYPSVENFSRQANRVFGESSTTLRSPAQADDKVCSA